MYPTLLEVIQADAPDGLEVIEITANAVILAMPDDVGVVSVAHADLDWGDEED
jgi:hypothetical protein